MVGWLATSHDGCKQVDQLDITLGSALDIMHEFIPDFSSSSARVAVLGSSLIRSTSCAVLILIGEFPCWVRFIISLP